MSAQFVAWLSLRELTDVLTLYYFTTFYFLSYGLFAMAVLRAIASLYRAGGKKPIERYKTRVKVAEDNKLFMSSSFLGSTSKLGVI